MSFRGMSDAAIVAELGRRIARARTDRNITQSDLAERSGIGRSTLARIESGKSVSLDHFIAILRSLRSVDSLDEILPDPPIRPSQVFAGDSTTPRQRSRPRPPGRQQIWGHIDDDRR